MPTPLPPGWYPNPDGSGEQLYWDGREWHTAPPPPPRESAPQDPVVGASSQTQADDKRIVTCATCDHVQTIPREWFQFRCENCGSTHPVTRPQDYVAPPSAFLYSPPTSPSEKQSKQTAVNFGVLILGGIGVFLSSFTSVSLLSGTSTVWVGAALAGIATALAFFLGASKGIRVLAAICLAISLFSAVSIEYQLDQKRREISEIFRS